MIKAWKQRSPRFFWTVVTVLGIHLLLLVSFTCFKHKKTLYIPKKIAVKTRSLPPSPVSVKPAKKTAKKTPVKKVKKTTPSKQKKLLSEVQNKLAQIESKPKRLPSPSKLTVPSPVNIDTPAAETLIYQDLLIDILKDSLKLPNYGKVTIKLTLFHSGGVKDVEVVSSESDDNQSFLVGQLQKMQFPEFQGDLKKADDQTFLLTFCSR